MRFRILRILTHFLQVSSNLGTPTSWPTIHWARRVAFWLAVLFTKAFILYPTRFSDEYAPKRCPSFVNKVYQYSLVSPRPNFPHGIYSEDGFYNVAANGTVLCFHVGSVSFVLSMIFNHDPPMCVNCEDCGHHAVAWAAVHLSLTNRCMYAGSPVCITLGRPSSIAVHVQDEKSPHTGIIVKMINAGPSHNCSLSVSVVCDSTGVQVSLAFKVHGYSTELMHPLGCTRIISACGSGLGWFSTLLIIILRLYGDYLLAGAVYRYSILHVRCSGIDVIPNLEFWASVPHRVQSLFFSLERRFRGPSHGHRSSYSSVNF